MLSIRQSTAYTIIIIINGILVETPIYEIKRYSQKNRGRLSLLHSHDAWVLLKNSLIISKLPYFLRATDCSSNQFLSAFDNALRSDRSTILNVNLCDNQWLQASLTVTNGELGIRLFRIRCIDFPIRTIQIAKRHQTRQVDHTEWDPMIDAVRSIQCSRCTAEHFKMLVTAPSWADVTEIFFRASSEVDKARLLSASRQHSGDGQLASPISSVALTCRKCGPETQASQSNE